MPVLALPLRRLLPIALGKACPVCGARTRRRPTPLPLRPAKLLTLGRCSYRICLSCLHWKGLAIHS